MAEESFWMVFFPCSTKWLYVCDCAIPVKLKLVQKKPETTTQNNTLMICASIRPDKEGFLFRNVSWGLQKCPPGGAALSVKGYHHEPYHKIKSIFGVCTVYSEITALCFIDLKITQYVLVRSNVVFSCCRYKQLIGRTLATTDRGPKSILRCCAVEIDRFELCLMYAALRLFTHTK